MASSANAKIMTASVKNGILGQKSAKDKQSLQTTDSRKRLIDGLSPTY